MALTDESGSATAVISGDLAEQLLSATTDTIFQKTCIKHEQLCPNMPTKCCATEFFTFKFKGELPKGLLGAANRPDLMVHRKRVLLPNNWW